MAPKTATPNQAVASALAAVQGHELVDCERVCTLDQPMSCRLEDIPLLDPVSQGSKTTVAHTYVVEVFNGLTAKPNLTGLTEQERVMLDPPLGFKQHIPNLSVQFFVSPEDTEPGEACTWRLVKLIKNPARISTRKLQTCCGGALYIPDAKGMTTAPRHLPLVLLKMLMRLGGESSIDMDLQPIKSRKRGAGEAAPNRQKTFEEIEEGFEYIRLHAPRGNSENEQLRWLEHQKNDPNSPVYSFKDATIEKAMTNLASNRAYAAPIKDFPLTLLDLSPWALVHIVGPCLKKLRTNCIWWIGDSGK
eukprot:1099844-Amphidinium_carterae.1